MLGIFGGTGLREAMFGIGNVRAATESAVALLRRGIDQFSVQNESGKTTIEHYGPLGSKYLGGS